MQGLGRHVLRVREFLGLSQEELARRAGVSQGAISRLENGRGLATPLLVVMRVHEALRTGLARLDARALSPEARRMVAMSAVLPGAGREFGTFSPASDDGIEEMVRLYRSVPERQRDQFLSVLRATAAALSGDPTATRMARSSRRG